MGINNNWCFHLCMTLDCSYYGCLCWVGLCLSIRIYLWWLVRSLPVGFHASFLLIVTVNFFLLREQVYEKRSTWHNPIELVRCCSITATVNTATTEIIFRRWVYASNKTRACYVTTDFMLFIPIIRHYGSLSQLFLFLIFAYWSYWQ